MPSKKRNRRDISGEEWEINVTCKTIKNSQKQRTTVQSKKRSLELNPKAIPNCTSNNL